ncbi:MAG: DUF6455 family protein [Pseudomonadota bacterium]
MPKAISTQASPCPAKLGKEVDHIWLIQRMAKTAQVDLVAAFEAGDLLSEDWATMIERCRGCAWAEGCSEWLSVPGQTADVPPEACLNRARMAALRAVADLGENTSAA